MCKENIKVTHLSLYEDFPDWNLADFSNLSHNLTKQLDC